MALSNEEQKLLDQMEAALAAEDPKLANTLRGSQGGRVLHRKRAALAGLGFVVGAVALIAGMQIHWVLSVVGFVIMLVSTVVALTSFRRADSGSTPRTGKTKANANTGFMDKMEERWRRRQGEEN
ncbi:DUF3040 domain-containing protein [Granulicoccus phenolivorans]|uniref:DUF3040 domain-containing protein n=1 Tax=Granulicoccus phenolivorans TaxID=266854 RepID=UPI00047D449C|nr:DUF3040 domain-containing protein [Granulicoccus phenolivorans]